MFLWLIHSSFLPVFCPKRIKDDISERFLVKIIVRVEGVSFELCPKSAIVLSNESNFQSFSVGLLWKPGWDLTFYYFVKKKKIRLTWSTVNGKMVTYRISCLVGIVDFLWNYIWTVSSWAKYRRNQKMSNCTYGNVLHSIRVSYVRLCYVMYGEKVINKKLPCKPKNLSGNLKISMESRSMR